MADLQLECWYDLGDAICMLPDGHDPPHGPTSIDEIWVSLVPERPNVTPVNDTTGNAIGVGALLLAAVVLSVVLAVPWVVGAWNIVQWIIQWIIR